MRVNNIASQLLAAISIGSLATADVLSGLEQRWDQTKVTPKVFIIDMVRPERLKMTKNDAEEKYSSPPRAPSGITYLSSTFWQRTSPCPGSHHSIQMCTAPRMRKFARS